jgi:Xaa-Pro dipeptidase
VDERRERVVAVLEEIGADWTVLTSPDAVCYATGHEVQVETGPSPFAGGPDTAFLSRDGQAVVTVPNLVEAVARTGYADEVVAYTGYSHLRQDPQVDNYLTAVDAVMTRHRVGGSVAVERGSLPDAVRERLSEVSTEILDVRPALDRARSTKTATELDLLRRAAKVTGTGQRAARAAVAPGRTELEVFGEIRTACEVAAGSRLPVMGDLLSGASRTAGALGWPTNRRMEPGDPVIVDLAPRVSGYWADSCNTLIAGAPSPALRRLHQLVARALAEGIEHMRAGTPAAVLDRRIRSVVLAEGYNYPHHTGHGIGTSVHEFPRIVPQETARLEVDMVVLLEPGAYDPDVGGVRLEWMFRVHEHGAELLSPFSHTLDSRLDD